MNKKYILEYINLINEFNEKLSKWIKYQNYKNIEIYIDREHVLNRFSNINRSSEELISFYNLSNLKYFVKKFLKQNLINLNTFITKRNPQGFFFIVTINTELNQYLYFTGELQFNKKQKCYQFGISTFLPNIKDGKPYKPKPNPTDIIISLFI